jgi:hypothetical protein
MEGRMTKAKHTPGPYFAAEDYLDVEGWGVFSRQFNPHDNDCVHFVCQAANEENAAFIVRACNSHYELLSAAKTLCLYLEDLEAAGYGRCLDNPIYNRAQAAIAKAEGGAA